jgi:hypothetical protein
MEDAVDLTGLDHPSRYIQPMRWFKIGSLYGRGEPVPELRAPSPYERPLSPGPDLHNEDTDEDEEIQEGIEDDEKKLEIDEQGGEEDEGAGLEEQDI